MKNKINRDLLELASEIGGGNKNLVILAEGNISGKIDNKTFFVKASGTKLGSLSESGIVEAKFDSVLEMINHDYNQEQIEKILLDSRTNKNDLKPSVETMFHAWLLQQENINFVCHTHPLNVNKILCSKVAENFAYKRLFPDQIVYCGPKSLLIEYHDPGLELTKKIKDGWINFVQNNHYAPKLILMKNHGLITVGPTKESVLATTLMAEKSAAIFLGSIIGDGPVFMPDDQVIYMYNRLDQNYRRKLLKIQSESFENIKESNGA